MTTFSRYIDMSLLIEAGFNIDFNDTSDIKEIRKGRWSFLVNNKEFLVIASPDSSNKWLFKFGTTSDGINIKTELTNTHERRETISILENVSKVMYLFLKKYKPSYVIMSADSQSRVKVYDRLLVMLFNIPDITRGYDYLTPFSDPEQEADDKIKYFKLIRI
jgi:hypothetical protein